MATVIFAHGFNTEKAQDTHEIIAVGKLAEAAGHDFIAPVFDWREHPSVWLEQYDNAINSVSGRKILFGNKTGAPIAASRVDEESALIICSLRPLFLENLIDHRFVDKFLLEMEANGIDFSREQIEYLEVLSLRGIISRLGRVALPVAVLIGGNEVGKREVFEREISEDSRALASAAGTKLKIIPSVGADILHPRYIKSVDEALKNIEKPLDQ